MQPSDASSPSAWATVPLAPGLPRCECLFLATADVRSQTPAVHGGLVTGAPSISRMFSRRNEALPGSWVALSHAPHPHTTPGVASLARNFGRLTMAFRKRDSLGSRETRLFEAGTMWLVRSHAYASPLPSPGNVARLASEWRGCTVSGGVRTRGTTNRISEAIASLPPSGPAFPGRTASCRLGRLGAVLLREGRRDGRTRRLPERCDRRVVGR